MWIAVIIATFMSLIGYHSLIAQAAVPATHDAAIAQSMAADMATYRFAVVAYANANVTFTGTVPTTALHFPTGYIAPATPMWSNEIFSDGTIIIFATATPPVGLTSAINKLAGTSPMLVQPNLVTATATVQTPDRADANVQGLSASQSVDTGSTTVSLTSAAQTALSALPTMINNVPVWFAHRG